MNDVQRWSVLGGIAVAASLVAALAFRGSPRTIADQATPGIVRSAPASSEVSAAATAASPPTSAPDLAFGYSYGSARDIWAYAKAMRASKDPAKLFEATHAIQDCAGLERVGQDVATFLSGGRSMLKGEVTPERQLAYSDLVSRCSGYRLATAVERRQLLDDLKRQGEIVGAREFVAYDTLGSAPSLESVEALVLSRSPTAVAAGLPVLGSAWASSLGFHGDNDERRTEIQYAAILASCELGTDCSSGSYLGQLQCVMSGACGRLWDGIESDMPQAQVTAIAAYKATLVAAVKSGDLSSLRIVAAQVGH